MSLHSQGANVGEQEKTKGEGGSAKTREYVVSAKPVGRDDEPASDLAGGACCKAPHLVDAKISTQEVAGDEALDPCEEGRVPEPPEGGRHEEDEKRQRRHREEDERDYPDADQSPRKSEPDPEPPFRVEPTHEQGTHAEASAASRAEYAVEEGRLV